MKLLYLNSFANKPKKQEPYQKLTQAINHAKSNGDLDTLRQIANDPHGYILRQGWTSLDFRDEEQVSRLRKLWESLEMEILSVLEATNGLHASPEFELHELIAKKPEMLDSVVVKQTGQIEAEITALKGEADQLGKEIEELTGEAPPMAAI